MVTCSPTKLSLAGRDLMAELRKHGFEDRQRLHDAPNDYKAINEVVHNQEPGEVVERARLVVLLGVAT